MVAASARRAISNMTVLSVSFVLLTLATANAVSDAEFAALVAQVKSMAASTAWKSRVNVLEFGADPSGAKDSTSQIQAAMDSLTLNAGTGQYGGIVDVPTGRFRCDGVLNVPASVTLLGTFRSATAHAPYACQDFVD